jgi:hypothetical protein
MFRVLTSTMTGLSGQFVEDIDKKTADRSDNMLNSGVGYFLVVFGSSFVRSSGGHAASWMPVVVSCLKESRVICLSSLRCPCYQNSPLQVLAPATSALPNRSALLDTVVALELNTSPSWVTAFVRADVAAGCLLFQGPAGFAKSALRLVNTVAYDGATEGGPDWDAILTLLGLVRHAVLSPSNHMPPEIRTKWDAKLTNCEQSVSAARLLARHNFSVPPMVIQRLDGPGLCVLLRETLTAAAAHTKMRVDAGEEEEASAFARLWRDMRDVHAYSFGRAMPLTKVLEEFIRTALLAQCWAVAEQCVPCVGGGRPNDGRVAAENQQAEPCRVQEALQWVVHATGRMLNWWICLMLRSRNRVGVDPVGYAVLAVVGGGSTTVSLCGVQHPDRMLNK